MKPHDVSTEKDEIVCEVAHCDACDGWVEVEERDANDGMHRECRKQQEAMHETVAWGE